MTAMIIDLQAQNMAILSMLPLCVNNPDADEGDIVSAIQARMNSERLIAHDRFEKYVIEAKIAGI